GQCGAQRLCQSDDPAWDRGGSAGGSAQVSVPGLRFFGPPAALAVSDLSWLVNHTPTEGTCAGEGRHTAIYLIQEYKMPCQTPIIVALDFPDAATAVARADRLNPTLCRVKVGK